MKKILTVLLIASLAVTGIFAEQVSGTVDSSSASLSSSTAAADGTTPFDSNINLKLGATVGAKDYTAVITYGEDTDPTLNSDLSNTTINGFSIDGADIDQTTDVFGLVFKTGSLKDSSAYKTTITPSSFIGEATSTDSGVTPSVVAVNSFPLDVDSISTTITSGYNAAIGVAAFQLNWTGVDGLPVDTYYSTVQLTVTAE